MGAVSVLWYTVHMTPILVELEVLSQLQLGLDLEQMVLPSHLH